MKFWKLSVTVLTGMTGGLLLYALGFPAAWLTGSAVAVAILAVAGHAVQLPRRLQQAAFLLIGVSMGGGMSPHTLERAGEWPESIAMLVLVVSLATFFCYIILNRYGGWDRATAMCGAIPGNLSLVIATSAEHGAATERVAIAHTLRLIVLIVVVPPTIAVVAGDASPLAAPATAGLADSILLVAAGSAVGLAAAAFGVPGGLLIGAFLASGVLHAAGVVDTLLPVWIVGPALILLGASIGARFAGIDLATFLSVLKAATFSLIAAVAVCLIPGAAFSATTGLPLPQVLLAFAPGGLEAMITLAFVLNSDVPYVAALHMIRVVTLALALPFLLRLVERQRRIN